MNRKQFIALGIASVFASFHAIGQTDYPIKPITLVVPTAPGGSTDFTARLIANSLTQTLGQPVIVDNKPGASGNIGNKYVARSASDGYTLLVSYSGYHVGNPHLFKQAGWDPIKDFAPVSMLTTAPQVIVGRASLPAANVKELIAYAKANPGKLNYASSGNGSIQHIAGELLKQRAGISLTHVPYKGSGQAVQDLLGGQVDLFVTTPASVVSQVQAGKLKAFAVTGKQRLSSLPNVPTAVESGLAGYELDSWFALYAPAGTPSDVVTRLNTEVNKILSTADTRKKAEDSGMSVVLMNPQQLAAFTRSELERWGKVIRDAQIIME